jgi:hypothetical protein
MTTAKENAPVAARAEDPVDALCRALRAETDGAEKKAAREQAGAMTQRPWEQLPPILKSAIRTDIGRLIRQKKTIDEIVAAGYSVSLARRAARDLGRAI